MSWESLTITKFQLLGLAFLKCFQCANLICNQQGLQQYINDPTENEVEAPYIYLLKTSRTPNNFLNTWSFAWRRWYLKVDFSNSYMHNLVQDKKQTNGGSTLLIFTPIFKGFRQRPTQRMKFRRGNAQVA